MTAEPVAVDASRFFEFVGSAEVVVVFVSVHPAHTFNGALGQHLREEEGAPVLFGAVALTDLMLSAARALPYLHQQLRACGAPSLFGVTPGYWLFCGGQMIAWQSGLPSSGDVMVIARSALLGAVWSGLSRNLDFLGQAFYLAAGEAAAQRVAGVFRSAIADHRAGRPLPFADAAARSADDVLRACQVLGVRPDASDEVVNDAWRKRRMEYHPDRAAGDPVEFERRNRMSAEINLARDVILNRRSRAGPRPRAQAWG